MKEAKTNKQKHSSNFGNNGPIILPFGNYKAMDYHFEALSYFMDCSYVTL